MAKDDVAPAAIIRPEGTFDLPSARLIEHSLKRMGPGDEVCVDFTRVRVFHDYGIAVLAQALKNAAAVDVKVEGLGRHHVRLLRYFGVDARVFRPDQRRGDGHE